MRRFVPLFALLVACAPAPVANSIDPCPSSIEALTVDEETVEEADWNEDVVPDRLVIDRSACGAYGDCPYTLYLSCGSGESFAAWTAYAQQARIEGAEIIVVERHGEIGEERLSESRLPIPLD